MRNRINWKILPILVVIVVLIVSATGCTDMVMSKIAQDIEERDAEVTKKIQQKRDEKERKEAAAAENMLYEDKPEEDPVYKNKKEELLFNNGNIDGVQNGGKSPSFKVEKTILLTSVKTYHWNDEKGTASPGEISLKDAKGKSYGPWKTSGIEGQGGVANAYWEAKPNIVIEAGTYTITDTDPATFSQNAGTKGLGMVWVSGKK